MAVLGPPPTSSARGGGAGFFDNIVQRASNPNEDADALPPVDADGNSRRITMYRNGFTIDDGPLRDLASPESRAFITSLENGDVPAGMLCMLLIVFVDGIYDCNVNYCVMLCSV